MMTHRTIVSLAATMTAVLALGACTQRPLRPPAPDLVFVEPYPPVIDFDNGAPERIDVYLLADRRQWLLGRIEPGAHATLRIPEASFARDAGFVQLAVLTGERLTTLVARESRAVSAVAQPASAILSQRWMFAQGQITSLQLD
jgi:hypothetical protein